MKGRQQEIMDFLLAKGRDGADILELVQHLKITKTAVRGHLQSLEQLGFIQFKDSSTGVGRPRRLYLLTPTGAEAFPRQYSWLSNELLSLIAETSSSTEVVRLMQALAKKVAKNFEDSKDTKPADRLKSAVALLNNLGYRAQLKQTDVRKGAVVEAINCVYHSVAQRHPELCSFDVQLLRSTTQMDVKLETCIARGGQSCRFCFTRRKT